MIPVLAERQLYVMINFARKFKSFTSCLEEIRNCMLTVLHASQGVEDEQTWQDQMPQGAFTPWLPRILLQ